LAGKLEETGGCFLSSLLCLLPSAVSQFCMGPETPKITQFFHLTKKSALYLLEQEIKSQLFYLQTSLKGLSSLNCYTSQKHFQSSSASRNRSLLVLLRIWWQHVISWKLLTRARNPVV